MQPAALTTGCSTMGGTHLCLHPPPKSQVPLSLSPTSNSKVPLSFNPASDLHVRLRQDGVAPHLSPAHVPSACMGPNAADMQPSGDKTNLQDDNCQFWPSWVCTPQVDASKEPNTPDSLEGHTRSEDPGHSNVPACPLEPPQASVTVDDGKQSNGSSLSDPLLQAMSSTAESVDKGSCATVGHGPRKDGHDNQQKRPAMNPRPSFHGHVLPSQWPGSCTTSTPTNSVGMLSIPLL
jgi:hypothetical protein